MEGASQDLKPTSDAPSSARVGSASCSNNLLQNPGVLSGGVSFKHDLPLSSAQVAEKFKMKDGSSNKSGNLSSQRILRVRIKMSSDKMAHKNVAIYSGLGLENSPSSSLENGAEESGGQDHVPQETADESPTSILQVMTSFILPEGVLMSPLHEDLLCLIGKNSRDWESVPPIKGSQENSTLLADESVASMRNGEFLKEKNTKLVDKSERQVELKHATDMKYKSVTTSLLKKKLEIENPGGKEINSNALRCSTLANSVCSFGSLKGTGSASEISREADNDGMIEILFSSNTEDSLESLSGKDSRSGQKNSKNSSVERVLEQGGVSSKNDVLRYHVDSGRYRGSKASTRLKSHSDGSKFNEGAITPQKQKVDKTLSLNVQDKMDEYCGRTNSFVESKNSKGNQSRGKAGAHSKKGSLRDDTVAASKNKSATYDAYTCESRMLKLKLQKDTIKVRDLQNDFLIANLEQMNNPLERQSSGRPKDSRPNNLEVELRHNTILDKSKEKIGKKVSNHAMSGPFVKDAPILGPCNLHGAEMVPAAADPIVIEENWVCCDNCQKWRLLPYGTKPEQLPDNWLCSMLNWLPGMNRCDISEEETTKAVNAFYQLPVIEGQNSVQNFGNETASLTTLAHGRQQDLNQRSLSSASVSIRGKKNNGLKEIPKVGGSGGILKSKSTKSNLKDYVKSRSLNDMNQPLAESKIMKKPSSLHFNMSCDLDAEKHKSKLIEKQLHGGDAKQLKIKRKRNADQHEYATSKKAKIEDMYATDIHRNSGVGCRWMGHKPSTGLQTKAGGKTMLEYEFSYSDEAKGIMKDGLLLSRKKLGNQAEVSLDGESLDMKTQGKRNHSVKKSKWQENLGGHDSKEYAKEESSESGFGREKTSGVQKTEGKNSSACKGADNKSNTRGTPLMSSNCHPVDMENVESGDKDKQLREPRRKVASKQTLDGIDLMRRVFGSGEVSEAATSSSSKVSSSRKNRGNFKEVKGSPVESVSSSPFRTFYPGKLTLTAEDTLRKNDGEINCLPVNSNPESCWNGEGGVEINQSVLKERVKCESEINFANNALCQEIKSEDKHSVSERYRSMFYEDEKNYISRRDLERQLPRDGRMEKQDVVKENHDSSVKLCASTNVKVASQQKLLQHYEAEEKVNHLLMQKRNGMAESVSLCQIEDGQKTEGHQSVQRSLKEGMFDQVPIADSCKVDVSKASNHPGTVGNRNGAHRILLHCTPDLQVVKDLNAPSSRSTKSSSRNATNALKEAKELRDYANRLKSSGFDFESNEAYFQAALKFLHGAFLLETYSGEAAKNGEMTQIQIYNTTAKLCKSCAYEYERCQEMGAAVLAYKCMEVAYMWVVYCKNSSTSRDWNELQATLHIASQGESPSSSASDVDNLNNQITADKATSSKGAVSCITGNHVIVARKRPNFIRLLDFTQDVNFALEASRKSQNAFAAANATLEEAQNRECIATIKRVIDFSFQDVEGFLHLVRLAMEAINRSGFGGARDLS